MYARVAVARPFAEPLTYSVPAHLGDVALGHVVLVPLGKQAETGYVIERLYDASQLGFDPAKAKPIKRVLDPLPAFDEEQLDFLQWVARYYKSPLGMVLHTALPSQIRAKVLSVVHATEAGVAALTTRTVDGEAAQVLREVVSRPGLTRRGITRRLSQELDKKQVQRALRQLERDERVAWADKEVGGVSAMVPTVVRTAAARPEREGKRMTALLDRLEAHDGPMDLADLLEDQPSSARSVVTRLQRDGLVELGEREQRDLLDDAPALGPSAPPVLNEHQSAALEVLTAPDAVGAHLLYGVTGAGKTEVFLGAARATLDRGKQVLVLVPEIGLTPQLVGRFRARFGRGVAVLHSGLTGAQRLAAWRRIRAGEVDLAVGARSALFAPFRDLGLIVVDEEHDDSYKQDEGVPYSARDLAVVLAHRLGCPAVLASATPSLESWHNARTGRYTLLRLPERATKRPVPQVEVVDLTEVDVPEGQERPLLAPEVHHALRETFDRGGQAIVLYNRRGYATVVSCTSCGATYECPNCGVSMTLHKGSRRVTCHYCALSLGYDKRCPVCHADGLDEGGKGTEQIEERLREAFPDVAIARMDADTTAQRGAHHRILTAFREGHTQLLVGTQIVAKGHDFPGVHTAVVISADRGFRMPDFRAAERTFALLVQVAGRAGRGEVPGRVLVQTWKPDHYVLQHLDDVERFVDVELRIRQTLNYPPVSRLCLLRLDGVDRRAVVSAAEALGRDLRQAARGQQVGILGPAPAAMPRLVGRWRFQLVVRSASAGLLQRFLDGQLPRLSKAAGKGVRVHWDVDPRHLM
jgi:primosomal protein N' (replication factor Y)